MRIRARMLVQPSWEDWSLLRKGRTKSSSTPLQPAAIRMLYEYLSAQITGHPNTSECRTASPLNDCRVLRSLCEHDAIQAVRLCHKGPAPHRKHGTIFSTQGPCPHRILAALEKEDQIISPHQRISQ